MDVRVSQAQFAPSGALVCIGWAQFDTNASTKDVRVSWAQFDTSASSAVSHSTTSTGGGRVRRLHPYRVSVQGGRAPLVREIPYLAAGYVRANGIDSVIRRRQGAGIEVSPQPVRKAVQSRRRAAPITVSAPPSVESKIHAVDAELTRLTPKKSTVTYYTPDFDEEDIDFLLLAMI